MKELKQAPKTMLKFAGTPVEVGSQIWERMCLPAVAQASRGMPPRQLGQLYAGFMLSAMGAMVADFGREQADAFIGEVVSKFGEVSPDLPGASSH